MLVRSQGCCWKKGSASAPSCIGRAGALRVPLPQHSRLMPLCTSASRNGQHEGDSGKELRVGLQLVRTQGGHGYYL
eukprot:scaffold256656_cov17-Tisochrysis_lutea.AAC.1